MDQNKSFLVLFLEPVKAFLDDDEVSEILINGSRQVYIEKHGKLQKTSAVFASEPALKAAASNIAKSVGRLLNEDNPRLDARPPRRQPRSCRDPAAQQDRHCYCHP